MAKFKVYGTAHVTVAVEVDIPDEYLEGKDEDEIQEMAIEQAYEDFGGLTNFVGNGGMDKLIGVYGQHESIEAPEEVEFTDVYD